MDLADLDNPSTPKVFVFDTNVILHDSSCLYQFAEHDIIIPIAVLEELDAFKKGNESIHFHAREFVRQLDALSGEGLFSGGVSISPNLGRVSILIEKNFHKDLDFSFNPNLQDHRILNIAYSYQKKNPTKCVIMVTKDVNLRMKCKSVGIFAQDYRNDHQIKDVQTIYKGHRVVENVDTSIIDQLYVDPFIVDPDDLDLKNKLCLNEFLIVRNGKKSGLAYFNGSLKQVQRVTKLESYGIVSRNAEQAFATWALLDESIQLVTLSGKAGTGKTLLSLAAALEKKDSYQQIFISRPVVPLGNKDIGYLPGNIDAKLIPYMQPLYDNLGVIQNQFKPNHKKYKQIQKMIDDQTLKIEPLSYIRGRNLANVYFIVDEAQNLTPHEVKTVLTRAGEGTKIILSGDIFQIDHPYLDTLSNGLSYLIERMKGQGLYAHINLEKGERSELAGLASDVL